MLAYRNHFSSSTTAQSVNTPKWYIFVTQKWGKNLVLVSEAVFILAYKLRGIHFRLQDTEFLFDLMKMLTNYFITIRVKHY